MNLTFQPPLPRAPLRVFTRWRFVSAIEILVCRECHNVVYVTEGSTVEHCQHEFNRWHGRCTTYRPEHDHTNEIFIGTYAA